MSRTVVDRIAVFVGPSAHGIGDALSFLDTGRFTFFPPVQRIDLIDLPAHYDTVVIVDGIFQTTPAVGHVELRKTLADRTVYGCSSMGAIRAYEMRDMGMIGFGRVYRMFFQFEDFTDDEVALLHGPAPDYLPISEPLVNIRCFLEELVGERILTDDQSKAIVDELRPLYFGQRTLGVLAELLDRYLDDSCVAAAIAALPGRRVKTRDFIQLMQKLNDQ